MAHRPPAWSLKNVEDVQVLKCTIFYFKCHTSVLPRSAEAQMLDLQRPETQLARRLRPTGGPSSARGSLGPKRGVGAASGRVSCAAHTKRSQMSEAARRFLRLFRLITSRVLVESACPSGGGRGQLKRSPFPSFMRLRDPQAQREQKGTPHAFRDSTLRFCVLTPEKVNSSKFK